MAYQSWDSGDRRSNTRGDRFPRPRGSSCGRHYRPGKQAALPDPRVPVSPCGRARGSDGTWQADGYFRRFQPWRDSPEPARVTSNVRRGVRIVITVVSCISLYSFKSIGGLGTVEVDEFKSKIGHVNYSYVKNVWRTELWSIFELN